jgi:predicted component of type VI protein secretion system
VFLGRVVADGDPLWTDEDRDYALALLAVEADRCDGCGHQRSESTSIEADSGYRAEKLRCHACRAIAEASERWADDSKGLLISLSRVKTP